MNTVIYTYTVYALRHNVTGRIYVGLTRHYKDRKRQHVLELRKGKHTNKSLQDDFNRYGDDFSFFELETLDVVHRRGYSISTPTEREKYWQCKFKTYDPAYGYNRCDPKYRRLKSLKIAEQ